MTRPHISKFPCECSDPGCPVPHGSTDCERPSAMVPYRIDMDDESGVAFCEQCADDAMESGVFTGADDMESDDDEGG